MTMEVFSLQKRIAINASPAVIWEALTVPAVMQRWIVDVPVQIIITPRCGGQLQFSGDLHGIPFNNHGEILHWKPEQFVQYTYWSSLSQQADVPEHYARISFRLDEPGHLHFAQENILTAPTYHHFNYYWNTALGLIKKVCEEPVQ
ncbi:hypothetical protein DCC81_05880 [Chitinophaga parva]|uniref:Activator of Hsp90 ATPase homologue 1/2-like C-terminal domain-containing protein n=2 Tax=Chitinophaga parva TaxID=2169414 RepID=A0A2T7BMT8_9BACT|nr:hypothetical protein DCC81_05880 [Chitinophaga parva]